MMREQLSEDRGKNLKSAAYGNKDLRSGIHGHIQEARRDGDISFPSYAGSSIM